jgi:hypothetical protein
MRALLPWLSLFFSRSAYFASFDPSEKQAREARLAGMAFAMHRTQLEKFIAKRVAKFLLGKDVLQSKREFAETSRFGPGAFEFIVSRELEIGEEAATALGAFFEAGLELLKEYAAEPIELILIH